MTIISEVEKNYIIRRFFYSPNNLPGISRIGEKLLADGKVIVAGPTNVFNGFEVNEFIKTSPAPDTIDCLLYEFDLEGFLESDVFFNHLNDAYDSNEYQMDIETVEDEIRESQERLNRLKSEFSFISKVIENYRSNDIIK